MMALTRFSTRYRVLTTIVLGMLSCQPLGGVPKNENSSNGISLQKVLPTICPSVGVPPSTFTTLAGSADGQLLPRVSKQA